MRTLPFTLIALVLAGCSTNTQPRTALSPEQAGTLAQKLANEEAFTLYRCQPFHDDAAARFEQDRWVWSDRAGAGPLDIEATVSLAIDGSTNHVNLKLLDSRSLSLFR